MALLNKYKAELGLLLAKGHAKFGVVAPRRPYPKDDDEGGTGVADLSVEDHPLLSRLPVGASSPELTGVTSDNSQTTDEALDRVEELTAELQNQPRAQAELSLRYSNTSAPKPSPMK
jgi:hypothetical protein